MKGKFLSTVLTLAALGLMFCGTVAAAPDALTGDEKSTTKLIELSKPEDDYSTFSDSCQVSGTARYGVKITVYIKKNRENTYEMLKVNDGIPVSWTVGASGYFLKEIGLERDSNNKILVYAEKGDDFQIIKREVNVKRQTWKEVLKNGVVRFEDMVSRIIRN